VDDHPELDGYEPFEEKPLRSRRFRRLVQGAALLAVFLLIMPFFASQARVASISAANWCAKLVAYEVPEPSVPAARFELFGPGVLGWECYATQIIGGDRYVGFLGVIPGPPNLDDGRVLV
jgi:hypothetical protein